MKHRGVEIFREYRIPGGKVAGYFAVVDGRRLHSNTLAGIKVQIGRVLNGFPPADCYNCKHLIHASLLNPGFCEITGRKIDPGVNFECDDYQVSP